MNSLYVLIVFDTGEDMLLTAMNTDNVAKLLTPQDLTYWSFPDIIVRFEQLWTNYYRRKINYRDDYSSGT